MTVTYAIQNRYKQGRARAIESAKEIISELGIDLDPQVTGNFSGLDWDAKVGISEISVTVVVKVYDRPALDLDLPFLNVFESSDLRQSSQW